MKVVEIFKSIEGEGKRTGLPCSFIRLFGCNLACSYCDTTYGWQKQYEKEATEMSVKEILHELKKLGLNRVTVTGGEPLIHKDIDSLLTLLTNHGYEVNVETNGSITPRVRNSFIFYTMDYKTYSSGMSDRMSFEALRSLRLDDVLKFVIGSTEDLYQALRILDCLLDKDSLKFYPQVYFSPVYGKIEPKEIVKFVLDNHLDYCHVQVQLHKIIWNSDERGV